MSTSQNPADLATRGVPTDELIHNNLWWHGPSWLTDDPSQWPSWKSTQFNSKMSEQTTKQYSGTRIMHGTSTLAGIPSESSGMSFDKPVAHFGIIESNYSSLTKLLRVSAWVLRFIRKLHKKNTTKGQLTSEEISQAKVMWEKYVQKSAFTPEINAVKENSRNNLKNQLGLQLDENGVLRCHGRLICKNLPEYTVFPKLLPRNHLFTSLVIKSFHGKLMHAGVSHILTAIKREFWIPQGRSSVRRVLLNCLRCRRHQGGPYRMPKMAPYPRSRIEEPPPFTYTGLGPLYVKVSQPSATQKVWLCLFSCLAVRAIHLEVAHDMTAEQFLLCLRRFIATRGKPKQIISDNASQFKVVKSTVGEAWQLSARSPYAQSYLANEGIKWSFITELASWMGGFYERLIGLVKQCLRKSIGRICLTMVHLETVVKELEAVINSRPVVYVGADFSSAFTHTLGDFLSINPKTGVPSLAEEDRQQDPDFHSELSSSQKLLDTWRKGQKHLDMFWELWFNEYVLSLRKRTLKHLKAPRTQSSTQPTKGDVVLLKESSPRGTWKLAVVRRNSFQVQTGSSYSPDSIWKVTKPYAQLPVSPGMC